MRRFFYSLLHSHIDFILVISIKYITYFQLNERVIYTDDCLWRVYLKPTMGHSLQMLHLALCLAVSAAASLWSTGSHTMDWGSRCIHSTNCSSSTVSFSPTWSTSTKTHYSFILYKFFFFHLFIVIGHFFLVMVVVDLEPIYTLDETPVHHSAPCTHSFTPSTMYHISFFGKWKNLISTMKEPAKLHTVNNLSPSKAKFSLFKVKDTSVEHWSHYKSAASRAISEPST